MNVLRSNCTPHPIKSAPLHSHDCWEIILNLTGHNISHIDGRDYDITAQDVMVIPPFVEHGGFAEGDETYTDYTSPPNGSISTRSRSYTTTTAALSRFFYDNEAHCRERSELRSHCGQPA